jgi:hypothetical protein
MRFTQVFAAAALAAPLVLAAPTSSTPTTIDLSSDLTANPHYATALWQVKEKYPNISEEDAQTAALGYLEAIGVQTIGAPSNTTDSLVRISNPALTSLSCRESSTNS